MPKGKSLSHLNELLGRETTYSSKEKRSAKSATRSLRIEPNYPFPLTLKNVCSLQHFEKTSSARESVRVLINTVVSYRFESSVIIRTAAFASKFHQIEG